LGLSEWCGHSAPAETFRWVPGVLLTEARAGTVEMSRQGLSVAVVIDGGPAVAAPVQSGEVPPLGCAATGVDQFGDQGPGVGLAGERPRLYRAVAVAFPGLDEPTLVVGVEPDVASGDAPVPAVPPASYQVFLPRHPSTVVHLYESVKRLG